MKPMVCHLAHHFKYVRIDLFNLNGEVYFEEITFHPDSGNRKLRPRKHNRNLGDKFLHNSNACTSQI